MANDSSQSHPASSPLSSSTAHEDVVFGPTGNATVDSDASVHPKRLGQKNIHPSASAFATVANERVDQPSDPDGKAADEKLVDQTKQQIRVLVNEISALAKTDCSVQDFYQGFLTRTVNALASEGGAIWMRQSDEEAFKIQYHINLKQTVLATDQNAQKQHAELIKRIAGGGEPELIAPHAQSAQSGHGGNPTGNLLVFGPLTVNHQVVGLVEILQRPGAGPTTQRGYLRFLMQMCELASEFLTNEKIRAFDAQQAMWGKFDQFVQSVYGSLDSSQTAYAIANEGRRVIDCDRVSVLLGRGRNLKVRSVSGLDSIERRSDQIKQLARLSEAVVKGKSALWYDGNQESDTLLPPQIESKLHPYIDRSHCKLLVVIPLFSAANESQGNGQVSEKNGMESFSDDSIDGSVRAGKTVGALVVEQLRDSTLTPDFKKRVEAIVGHSEIAVTNALEHHSIFLLPLWKAIGKISSAFRGGNLMKTLGVGGVATAIGLALCWVPWPFTLAAKGALIPEVQRAVYAQSAGIMEQLNVSDTGDTVVEQGQVLAVMSNNDLAVAIENLRNSIVEAETRQAINESLRGQDDLSPYQRQSIEIEIEQAAQQKTGLLKELQLRQIEQSHLEVRAPTSGVVVNWQARQSLINRPVERGQSLMTIVDPDSRWTLELELPERRLGHLLKALNDRGPDQETLDVTFALASIPGRAFQGKLSLIDHQLDVHSDQGNTCLVRVSFDNQGIDQELLRTGTRVNATINCGTRPIGYAMLHEVIETIHAKFLLWF